MNKSEHGGAARVVIDPGASTGSRQPGGARHPEHQAHQPDAHQPASHQSEANYGKVAGKEADLDGSLSGILASMIGFGVAATRFAFDQMWNSTRMVKGPGRAFGRMKCSIDNLAHALNASVDDGRATGAGR